MQKKCEESQGKEAPERQRKFLPRATFVGEKARERTGEGENHRVDPIWGGGGTKKKRWEAFRLSGMSLRGKIHGVLV